MRKVHAEGMRERQNMKNAKTGGGRTDYVFVCRHCGAYHEERHYGDCPECDDTPPAEWSSTMTFPERLNDEQYAAFHAAKRRKYENQQ